MLFGKEIVRWMFSEEWIALTILLFKDHREFAGSLMKQMNEVYDFIDFRNRTRATIKKLLRIDVRN